MAPPCPQRPQFLLVTFFFPKYAAKQDKKWKEKHYERYAKRNADAQCRGLSPSLNDNLMD